VNKTWSVFSRLVLADAVKNGAGARNVAKVHKPPQPEQSEIEILDADQVEGVLKGLIGPLLASYGKHGTRYRHEAR
jgi:hypothetical protein